MVVHRQTARVLPVDAAGRVLLLLGRDPARTDPPYWFTVGGGAEPDETLPEAAVRELFEETGIRVEEEQLIGPIHRGTHAFSFNGVEHLNDSIFFAVAVDDHTVSFAGLDEQERSHIIEARWWAPDDLTAGVRLSNPDLPNVARLAVKSIRMWR